MTLTHQLHVDVHEGAGPYALIVHGILSSRAQWMLNLDALKTVCRPVVVELLGHGRSGAPEEAEPYTPHGYASAFERIRESLGAERWFVIGQSLGAALTMRYVLDEPDRVIAHVFTNSSSALADERWQERMKETLPEGARRVREGGIPALEALPIHPKHARRMPLEVRRELVEDAASLSPDAIAQTFLHTVPTSSVRARANENRVPTLLARGTREKEFDEAAAFAEANVPKLEIVCLDAGHAVNIQASDGFNHAVTAFFGKMTAEEGS